ncbi:MAG: UDP-N-acetylglucosamine 2-epimerase (non-hydrolyzing) [Armatimonadota bacterium]
MIKVMTVFGTRPEAIKMAPVLLEFSKNKKIDSKIVVTAQHRHMLDQVLSLFNLKPDADLNIMQKNQTLFDITSRALTGMGKILDKFSPDIVLVQGDTTSAFASALAAFYHKIPVGHIEAGLRTDDIHNPYPEEVNRRFVSVVSRLHFAPTKWAYNNLVKCGIKDNIYITGNTVIDALYYVLKKEKRKHIDLIDRIKSKKRKIIFVEAHRRENLGSPMHDMCTGLKKIVEKFKDVEIVFSVHKNPKVRETVYSVLKGIDRVNLLEPLPYPELVKYLNASYIILTDSGGIQEEAPSLGKPVLVLRKTTERPEGIKKGVAVLAGTDTDKIFSLANKLLTNKKVYLKMSKTMNPYGDGRAAERITGIILNYFGETKKKVKEYKE